MEKESSRLANRHLLLSANYVSDYCLSKIEGCQHGSTDCIFYNKNDFPRHCRLFGRPAEWEINTPELRRIVDDI